MCSHLLQVHNVRLNNLVEELSLVCVQPSKDTHIEPTVGYFWCSEHII